MTLIHNPKFRLFLSAASTWALMSMALEGVPFSIMSFAGHTLAASYALVPLIAIGYGLYCGLRFLQSMFAQKPNVPPTRPPSEPIVEEPEDTPELTPTPSPHTELTVASSSTPIIEEIVDETPVISTTSEPDTSSVPVITDVESDTSPVKTTQSESASDLSKEVDSTPDTPPLGSDSEGEDYDYPDFGGGFDEDDLSHFSSEMGTNIADKQDRTEDALNAPTQTTTGVVRPTACPAPTLLSQPLTPAASITDTQTCSPAVSIADTQSSSAAASEPGQPTRQRQRYFLPFMESIAFRVKNFPRERFVPEYYVPENFKKSR